MINIAIYNHDEDYVRQIKNTFLKSNLNKNIVFHKYNSKEDLIKAIKREQTPYIVCSKLGFANEYILCHSGQDSYKIAPKEIMYMAITKKTRIIWKGEQYGICRLMPGRKLALEQRKKL